MGSWDFSWIELTPSTSIQGRSRGPQVYPCAARSEKPREKANGVAPIILLYERLDSGQAGRYPGIRLLGSQPGPRMAVFEVLTAEVITVRVSGLELPARRPPVRQAWRRVGFAELVAG